ncbi:alpha/beta hydrolase fold family protein [Collimonas arenae]|uniref:Alpha/beta hydrolase fold family protein n=1 Tax=Collimonas arenae TaxID=279058 RepID=A0A127QIT3_9BURK|nr:alpha/beta hydrolase fold family protein [Collimonas arenae]
MTAPVAAVTTELQEALELLDRRFEERSADVDGATVSYRSCGNAADSGRCVVLLHGIGSGAASWLQCALALQQDAQVIAWNAPGYGGSTPLPMTHPAAADYALRLQQLLQALDVSDCLLVGHSLGAMMATSYVAAGYGHVKQLLLFSPAQGYGSDDKRQRGLEMTRQRLDALATLGVTGMAQKSPERMLSAQADTADRAWVSWNTQQLNLAGYAQAVQMLCGGDIHRDLPAAISSEVSVAVYCGDVDIVTTPQDSRALADSFQLPFQLIDDAGHACYVEQPEAVAAVIRRHLYQLS